MRDGLGCCCEGLTGGGWSVRAGQVLSFYPFVQKYMQPHQNKVTNILAFAAQAVHPLVPPDVVEPLIRTLANHFVSRPESFCGGCSRVEAVIGSTLCRSPGSHIWARPGH